MKKVIIIGGGVAGLSAGIYLAASGYDTEVIEKNAVVGGALCGWERKGCYIDGCIHWLTGTNPKSSTYKLWRDVGAINEDTEIFFQDELFEFRFEDGSSFKMYADTKKTEEELLRFAPEDKKAIKRWMRLIRRFSKIDPPVFKPTELMNLFELLKIGFTMAGDYFYIKKTSNLSCADFAKQFKNERLRCTVADLMSPGYNLKSMLYMLGHISGRDGGIPKGGSLEMAKRIEEKYLSLGGKIRRRAEVSEISVKNGRATGIILKDGEALDADWVVSTVPAEHCLVDLLKGAYPEKKIDARLSDPATYPIYTYTTAVFKCRGKGDSIPLSVKAPLSTPIMLDGLHESASFRCYAYDGSLRHDDGCFVVEASLHGNDGMYFEWKKIREEGNYKEKKQELGEALLKDFSRMYSDVIESCELIDVLTPLTYERYLNSRHGCFQSFVETSKGKSLMQNGRIKGLRGFILSGQWTIMSGGLPPAVMSGRFAAQRILHTDGKKFKPEL